MIHIGKKIEEVVRQQRIKITELAYTVNLTRSAVYDVFERTSIDTAQLFTFSTVLKHDFFKYYTQAFEGPGAVLKKTTISRSDIKAIRNTLKNLDSFLQELAPEK